jgi:hypothetical protein
MGFPENYAFPNNDLICYKLLGNSIPIPLAYNMLATLATYLKLQIPHHDNMSRIILQAFPRAPPQHKHDLLTPLLDNLPRSISYAPPNFPPTPPLPDAIGPHFSTSMAQLLAFDNHNHTQTHKVLHIGTPNPAPAHPT